MKICLRCLLWLFFVAVVLFVAVAMYIDYYGNNIFRQALSGALNRPVNVESFDYQFPFGMSAENLEVGEKFSVQYMVIDFDPRSLWKDGIWIREVTLNEPVLIRHNGSDQKGATGVPDGRMVKGTEAAARGRALVIRIKKMLVRDGVWDFSGDLTKEADDSVSFRLENVYGAMENLRFPLERQQYRFHLTGQLNTGDFPVRTAMFRTEGWIDFAGRNMEAGVNIEEPESSIECRAELSARDNRLKVSGHIKSGRGLWDPEKRDAYVAERPILKVFLRGVDFPDEILWEADFSFETLMDDFRPGKIDFTGKVTTHTEE